MLSEKVRLCTACWILILHAESIILTGRNLGIFQKSLTLRNPEEFRLRSVFNLPLTINTDGRKQARVLPQHCLSFTLVTALAVSVTVCYCLPRKGSITQRCKTTPDRKQYLHMVPGCSYIHASEFGVRCFPSASETQRHPHSTLLASWNPIAQIPEGTCPLLHKQRTSRRAADGKVVSNNCACSFRQTVLLRPANVRRPCARQTQHDSGPVTSPVEHLLAPALRSSSTDLGLTPLACSFHSQSIKADSQWRWMDGWMCCQGKIHHLQFCLSWFMETKEDRELQISKYINKRTKNESIQLDYLINKRHIHWMKTPSQTAVWDQLLAKASGNKSRKRGEEQQPDPKSSELNQTSIGFISQPNSCFEVRGLSSLLELQNFLHINREEITVWFVGIRRY